MAMPERISLPAALGRTVVAWGMSDRELVLRFKGEADERSLQCDKCSRLHWIVREQFHGGEARFLVTCHHCGRSGAFLLEGIVLPPP